MVVTANDTDKKPLMFYNEGMDSMPLLIVITHLVNLFAIVLLIRSGLQILNDHPMLYWTDHTRRDNYWIKFGKKKMPKDKLWTAHDEAENIGHYALPGGGHKQLGAGRNWHFAAAIVWVLTGLIYYAYMLFSGEWRRLIPTNWSIFPAAWHDLLNYLTFHIPAVSAFNPYDPIQQITYAAVVFLLAPLMIITALAMSPAFTNRFPGYMVIFGGRRQVARSLHFLGMIGFSVFILIHVTLVGLVYFWRNVRLITFGTTHVSLAPAITVFCAALLLLLVFNIVITYATLNHRVGIRRILVSIIEPVVHVLFGRLAPRKQYSKSDISEFFRINGYPPETEEFHKLTAGGYSDWHLRVYGLVDKELSLNLEQLRAMPRKEQITKHICIQGWSAIGEWSGVQMKEIIKLARPHRNVKYVVFHAYDVDGDGKPFYEALRLSDMRDELTILAYDMNWRPLTLEHGAPLRLRCERKLGYKMVKYIKSIEFVEDFSEIGSGRGGYREDNVLFDWEASI